MKANRYFKQSEFACKCCCGFDDINQEVVDVCIKVREFFDAPVTVRSGCRCPTHNAKVKGAKKSQHVLGNAADISVKNVAPELVFEYLDSFHTGGLKAYKTFTHVDCRGYKARWE